MDTGDQRHNPPFADFTDKKHGTWSEMEQHGLELGPIWDVDAAGKRLAC